MKLFLSHTFSHMNTQQSLLVILPACTTYENGTECSETLAHKIQMPGNHPVQHEL
jgi:hypothetical protein